MLVVRAPVSGPFCVVSDNPGCESGLSSLTDDTLLTPSLTPINSVNFEFVNSISFVASVNVLLYPGTFSFRMSISEGIRIKPGEMAKFKTTFVLFIAYLMSEMAFTGSSWVMLCFTSL